MSNGFDSTRSDARKIIARSRPIVAMLALAPVLTIGSAAAQSSQSSGDIPWSNQLIVRYRTSSSLLAADAPASAARMARLTVASRVQLTYGREMSGGAHVLRLPNRLPPAELQQLADRLQALGEVEYAEPDYILQHTRKPSDPRYSEQWHYFDQVGINAEIAWDRNTGANSVVAAVLDTGITGHADLADRIIDGYDFVSDTDFANDGNGRDADPSDPGDWTTSAEATNWKGKFWGCPVADSSWHGTHVAGTIGAATDNELGVAGVNWHARILPVRVLGKCGGATSDIADAIRWAAGLAVTGVPANSNPARVINMSLGGPGACGTTLQNAINDAVSADVTVVVAAGNSNTNAASFAPASCAGVITVAATNRSRNRASYSNFGSTVEISAPGGETGTSLTDGVLSTLNTGTQGPVADSYAFYQGTSMATPHVTGLVSLLLSINPSLTPAAVLQVIQSTAQTFPTGSTCSTSSCGAGILDAGAAVRLVHMPAEILPLLLLLE